MEVEEIALTLCLTLSSLSLLCSLLTLFLIHTITSQRLQRQLQQQQLYDHSSPPSSSTSPSSPSPSSRGGYHSLVTSLTICQMIYNLSFYFLLLDQNYFGRISYGFLNVWGGISSSLWSNILIYVIYQIVSSLQSINIPNNYSSYCLFVYLPSTILSILEVIFLHHQGSTVIFYIYFVIRSLSVIGNILLFGIIFYKFYQWNALTNEDSYKLNSSTNPIYLLALRLIYYCLVQTITRLGASWYQIQYGYVHNFHPESASLTQTIAYLMEFILTPSAGIGYLIVFLAIQPEAQKILWRLCGCGNEFNHSTQGRMSSSKIEELTVGLREESEEEDRRRGEYILWTSSSAVSPRHSNQSNSSLFPILEMDEDDLAKEIDRLYYYTSQHSAAHLPPPNR